MSRRGLALAVLACALVAAGGLRLTGGADKSGLTHDESISYLAAACHEGDYARITVSAEPPFGRWVAASEWKALLRPDRALCLGQISRDLAREDIHPPLYFWLLHVWALVFGVGLWTGLSLNIVLATLTGLALFGLGRRVLGDPLEAAAVAGVWSLSPAAIRVFGEARQYELLALLAVLLVWHCLRFADPSTRTPRRDALGLAVITAAGALTHFLFSLVAVAGAALLAVRLWRRERRRLAPGLASLAAGYAIFSLAHPGFLLSVRRGRAQAAVEATADLLGARAEATFETLAEFLLPPALAAGAAGTVAVATLAGATAWAILAALGGKGSRPDATAMPLVFVWLAAAHAALFLTFVSPGSGMDSKHLSALWPFAAFVPLLALGGLPGRVRVALATAGAVALATAATIAALGQFPAPGQTPPQLQRTDRLVLDNVARGVLPRIVWHLRNDALVFAAHQRHLLAHRGAWLEELGPGALYVGGLPPSDPRYGNSPALGRRVAEAISGRHRLVPVPGRALGAGRVYRIGPPGLVARAPRRGDGPGNTTRSRAFLERPRPRRAAG